MIDSFFTIAGPTTGSYKEKGSKFLAFAHPVTDSEQIKAILEGLRKEYFGARHFSSQHSDSKFPLTLITSGI